MSYSWQHSNCKHSSLSIVLITTFKHPEAIRSLIFLDKLTSDSLQCRAAMSTWGLVSKFLPFKLFWFLGVVWLSETERKMWGKRERKSRKKEREQGNNAEGAGRTGANAQHSPRPMFVSKSPDKLKPIKIPSAELYVLLFCETATRIHCISVLGRLKLKIGACIVFMTFETAFYLNLILLSSYA